MQGFVHFMATPPKSCFLSKYLSLKIKYLRFKSPDSEITLPFMFYRTYNLRPLVNRDHWLSALLWAVRDILGGWTQTRSSFQSLFNQKEAHDYGLRGDVLS